MLEGKDVFVFNDPKKVYVIKLQEKIIVKTDAKELIKKQIKTEAPREGCRAFITDLVVGDKYKESHISEVYKLDPYSDYVGAGKYRSCKTAFPNAAEGTFDGIAVDEGTRIIIFSKPDFQGEKLLDIIGPAIINNRIWKKDRRYKPYMKKRFRKPYQKMFPRKVRHWSETDMHKWTEGSIIITCENT